MLRFTAAGLFCSASHGMRMKVDSMDPTPSYTSRFAHFSVAEAEADIKRRMCEVYLSDFNAGLLTHRDVSCADWVEESVTIEDGPLITASVGDPSDPLVVFIHGWPDNAALWVNQFMALADHYHCVAVQLPNYLDALPTEELYIDEVVDRIGEVLDGREAFLVGHDWGANFGYMVAYKFPDLIKKYAALDIGNDLQMWLDAQEPSITSPTATFIRYYQTRLASAYEDPEGYALHVTAFGALGGSPSGEATARMGMYYARVWNRPEFTRRLAPNVPEDEWQSLWTPLGGTGIPQSGMLYLQGSNLATTDKFLDAVRSDGGRAVVLSDAGHWLPKDGAQEVTAEIAAWLSTGHGDDLRQENYPIVFSLQAAELEIQGAMCNTYFVPQAHPVGTNCVTEVRDKISIVDGPLVTARAGDPSNQMIVFIHGWPDQAGLWVNQLLRFSENYYCVAVQLPNYLDAMPTEELFLDEVADRIGAVMDGRPTLLVGHDWGANFGYMVAYRFPDVVLRYAALDIGNDLQMWTDVAPETRNLLSPMSVFIAYYQTQLAAAYRNCLLGYSVVAVFATTGGSPGGHATCRMGMYYDRAWDRSSFTSRMAPDVQEGDWQSLWTPLGGTGIPQSGMLYIQGSDLATTDKMLEAVREDGGTTVRLTDAGHWLPCEGAVGVNEALEPWLAGPHGVLPGTLPYDSAAWTQCPTLVLEDVYEHGYVLAGDRIPDRMSANVACAGSHADNLITQKLSCEPRNCNGAAWCFVRNGCSERFRRCRALGDQNPLTCSA